ncbi:hypothetical protein DSO57_1013145 [Entomophthora muscae]|uniref:Uncharacterized protein n=1 Tax=Entomophthora muscae TaxID=34485 RepID=A0ACC2TGR2_9FUNG|nr:hypothetical protein DSO57_1013145 [Entomophthora muscae]
MNLWFTNLIPYIFLILFNLKSSKPQYSSSGIDSQASVDKTKAFDYYCPSDALLGPVHFTEYPHNPDHKPWTLEDWQWYTCPNSPKDSYQILSDSKEITIYPLIFNRKFKNPSTYLVSLEPHLTPKQTISIHPTSNATGQSSQLLRVLYLAFTGLIDSAFLAARPWSVAGKALSYLVKLSLIIWWAMPVPAYAPPSPERIEIFLSLETWVQEQVLNPGPGYLWAASPKEQGMSSRVFWIKSPQAETANSFQDKDISENFRSHITQWRTRQIT